MRTAPARRWRVPGARTGVILFLWLVFLASPALLLYGERHVVRLERDGARWTLFVNGAARGTIEEPAGAPRLRVRRVKLFLAGNHPGQHWATVRIVDPREVSSHRFFPRGLGRWQGTGWLVDPFGARPRSRYGGELTRPVFLPGNAAVEATLLGGREGGLVLEGAKGERLRLWMRPFRHHDGSLTLTRDGKPVASRPLGPVGLEIGPALFGLVRQLGWVLVIAAALAAFVRGAAGETRRHPSRAGAAAATAAMAAGFTLAAWSLGRFVFEGMPHVQDGVALVFQARNFALGRLWSPSFEVPGFFDHEFVVNDGRWYGKYFPGASAIFALGILGGAPGWVNPLLGGGAILLVFRLGRRAFGTTEALVATALAATTPMLLLQSASYLSHPATLFFLAAFAVAFLGPPTARRRTVAGLALAAAILCRPQAALPFALPFAAAAIPAFVRRPAERASLLAAAAGGALGVALLAAYSFALTGSPLTTPFQAYSAHDRLGFGPVGVEWAGSFTPAHAIGNLRYQLESLAPFVSWVPPLLLALAVVPFLVGRAGVAGRLLGASGLALVALFFFYFHPGIHLGPRYWTEALPALAVLAGRGVVLVAAAGAARLPWRVGVGAIAMAVTLALAAPTVTRFVRTLDGYRGTNDMTRRTLDLAAGIPGEAIVFVDADEPWQAYGSVFWTISPDLGRNRILWARDGARYGLAGDRAPVPNERLTERFPGRTAYRVRDGKLERLPRASRRRRRSRAMRSASG